MRVLLAAIVFLVSVSTSAFQPRTGQWWNPNESGSGYNVDIQDGILVLTVFSYAAGGAAQWYFHSGKLTNGYSLEGTLDKYQNGQCVSCAAYTGFPERGGTDGAFTITFTSETSAVLDLPGGRRTTIQPFNFGFGEPPEGLLGEWVFIYDLGNITFADRFDFTDTGPATTGGNGLVIDYSRLAACELQTSGSVTGLVVCADIDALGNIENGYAFKFGLDETYLGLWVDVYSGRTVPMKGFKVGSKHRFEKALVSGEPNDPLAAPKVEAKAVVGTPLPANRSPDLNAIAKSLRNAVAAR